jgi:GTP-binding protein
MLVDNVILKIKAGNGGHGAATFLRNGLTAKGGPDGGNGGNGGNIYFQGSTNINDLREFRFKKKIQAEDGVSGKKQNLFGKNASHTTIYVPLGTRITDIATGQSIEITEISTPVLLALGGKGGRGNNEFKSATNQAPTYAEQGEQGEEKQLDLELRLIAEVGFIGLPNAGKSSLLAAMTNATPKIGNFAFTTLEPNIGMLGQHALGDIPGLIEGASDGRGLGVTFLKHIEKTKILLHCIEAGDTNVEQTYKVIRNEFDKYNPALLQKPEMIILTKTDLADKKTIENNKNLFEKMGKEVLTSSIYEPESLGKLKNKLENLV